MINDQKRGGSGKQAGVDGLLLGTKELEIAILDAEAGECHGQRGRLLATYVDGCSEPRIRASELEFSEVRNASGFERMCLMP